MLKIIAVFFKLYFISLKYAFQKKEIQNKCKLRSFYS